MKKSSPCPPCPLWRQAQRWDAKEKEPQHRGSGSCSRVAEPPSTSKRRVSRLRNVEAYERGEVPLDLIVCDWCGEVQALGSDLEGWVTTDHVRTPPPSGNAKPRKSDFCSYAHVAAYFAGSAKPGSTTAIVREA